MALTDHDIYVGWLIEWIISLCINVVVLIPTLRFFWCHAQSNEDDEEQVMDKDGVPMPAKQIVIMPVRIMAILYFVFWSIACILLISEASIKVSTRPGTSQHELDVRDDQEDLLWTFGMSLAGAAELIFCLLLLSNLRAAFKDTVYECGRNVYIFYAVLTLMYLLSGLAYIGTVLSEEEKWVRVMLMMSTAGIVLFTRFTLIALFIHKLMLLIAESSANMGGSSVTPAHTLHMRNLSSSPERKTSHGSLGSLGSTSAAKMTTDVSVVNHIHNGHGDRIDGGDGGDNLVVDTMARLPALPTMVPELSADSCRSTPELAPVPVPPSSSAHANAHSHVPAHHLRHIARDRSRINDEYRYAGHMNTITKHLLLGSTAIVVSAFVVILVLVERGVRTLDDEDKEAQAAAATEAPHEDAQDFNAFTFVAISCTIVTVWIEWMCVFLSYTFNDFWYKYLCHTCHNRCCMPCTGKRVLKMRRSLKGARKLNIQVPQSSI